MITTTDMVQVKVKTDGKWSEWLNYGSWESCVDDANSYTNVLNKSTSQKIVAMFISGDVKSFTMTYKSGSKIKFRRIEVL